MIQLYSYRRCPFAMRVRMVLHEKKIPFETIEENLKQKSEKLNRLHPQARVPLLIHDDHIIYESAIITQYLEEAFDQHPRLLPKEPHLKAYVHLWTHWCNQTFKPHIDHYKYGTHRSPEQDVLDAPANLIQDLHKMEAALTNTPYLVGSHLTLADIHVFPFLRQLSKATPSFKPLERHPRCQQWLESMISRPSFELTMQKKKA